ncbi:MAG: LysM domain-containing protein [Candidatus Portnoybacteria bacterium]
MKTIIYCLIVLMVMVPVSFAKETGLKEQVYVVKKGDTPADIFFVLRIFYHIPEKKILEWNPDMGLHLIYPGQKIKFYLPQDVTKATIKGETDKIIAELDQLKKEIGEVGILGVTKVLDELLETADSQVADEIRELRKDFQGINEQTNKETKRRFWLLIFLSIVILLAVVVLFFVVVKRTQKQFLEKNVIEVEIEIDDKRYTYRPKIDKDGKFISFYRPKKAENCLLYSKIADLRKSVTGSFKKDPKLVAQEIKSGRLVQQKQK